MPANRLSMRKIKEVLRLKWANDLSDRKIAQSCNVSRPAVANYIERAEQAGLSWPLPNTLNDTELERLLFPTRHKLSGRDRVQPDLLKVHQELQKKNVTLFLLWQEYREQHPKGYQYSWFCDQYRNWLGTRDLSMRQTHRAGEKLFVDYAGHTLPVIDPRTGEIRSAQIFVAVLGASNYTYAESTWSQSLPDWIGSHQRCFSFFGGLPEQVVPDNLRSGVTKAHRYEPDLNPTYLEMATHYGVTIIPARVRKPKDKAKAEVGVQIVERWILASLRNHSFFSLTELNQAIQQLLLKLNQRPFKKLPGSRAELFQSLDKPALKALPIAPYVYAEWKLVRVHIDYHVDIEGHYYSVPYRLVKLQLDVRITENTIEVFNKGDRVASHLRSWLKGRHTTLNAHRPESHQYYGDWSPERFINWAGKIGSATCQVITVVLQERRHPEQGYRSCLGILRLAKAYSDARLEAACARALLLGTCRYKSIESILKHGLDSKPVVVEEESALPQQHENVRGSDYYH
jgi:transposase